MKVTVKNLVEILVPITSPIESWHVMIDLAAASDVVTILPKVLRYRHNLV